MAATTAFTTIPNPNIPLIINSSKTPHFTEPTNSSFKPIPSTSLARTAALTGTLLSNLATSPLAMAAKQIAESPQQDNRGLALLVPVIPAIGWVLYNILGPALNQINRMRSEKGVILALGISGLTAAANSAIDVPSALAATETVENEGNNQGLLVLFVAAAVFLEVLLFSVTMKYESEGKGEGSSD